jgi:hypothetical protein
LDENILELDEGTRARNRAFQERLDEIWRSTYVFDAKLKVESQEAVESILHMKDEYTVHLHDFISNWQKEVHCIFDFFDKKTLPAESVRMDEITDNLQVFIKETVPATIEAQSGEVSRQLKRAYETFDIEKKKEEKRETKLINRAARHIQKTAQRFEDEAAFISSCFNTLEDDIVEHERRAARTHNIHEEHATASIVAAKTVAEKESCMRQEEDGDVLDTVIETQKILQKMVIDHFGSKSDEIDVQPFTKLEERMEKINKRKGSST